MSNKENIVDFGTRLKEALKSGKYKENEKYLLKLLM